MPITLRPGTTATRADSADIDRAISSERPMTREDFTPGAGSDCRPLNLFGLGNGMTTVIPD